MMKARDLEKFSTAIGYTFKDVTLLTRALRHRSLRKDHNERLEFLGDSILNCVIAHALFLQCEQASEGQLSRLRAYLVRGETLATLAKRFALMNYLKVATGEFKPNEIGRTSVLADAMEAVIGAIFLDGGMTVCETRILEWYQPLLESLDLGHEHKDPKTCLQEWAQAERLTLPAYEVIQIEGLPHSQTFHIRCMIGDRSVVTQGIGSSRRAAEQAAAEAYLKTLQKSNANS